MNRRCPKTKKRMYLKGQAISIAHIRSIHKGLPPGNAYECEHCGMWHVTKKPPLDKVWGKLK